MCGHRLCVFLQAACVRVEERETAQLLTHQLAVNCVTRVLTGWQQLLRAHTHWRQHTLQGCWAYWAYWAPAHKARNAGGQPLLAGICVCGMHVCLTWGGGAHPVPKPKPYLDAVLATKLRLQLGAQHSRTDHGTLILHMCWLLPVLVQGGGLLLRCLLPASLAAASTAGAGTARCGC